MRRTNILSANIVIFLLLAAFFNLLSYSLDQFIVQGEDKMREINNELQNKRMTVSNLSNSLNILQNLKYEISYEADTLTALNGFNSKSYNIFLSYSNPPKDEEIYYKLKNDSLIKNSKELELFYSNKIKEYIEILNRKAKQFHIIFKENFSSGVTFEQLKSDKKFKDFIREPIFFIEKSEFDAKENWESFNSLWDYNEIMFDVEDSLLDFEDSIKSKYLFSISDYFDALDRFSNQKNLNNYLILLSILSQILGLFFLLFLFRNLIKENY
jgi:hypothetical protein